MKSLSKSISIILIVFVLGFNVSSFTNTQAQLPFKISADKPGGGGSSTSSDSGSDDTIYIVAGVTVAAIVGYTLYKKFTSDEEDTDSAKSSIQRILNSEKDSYVNKIQEFKEKIPVDIHFGIKNSNTNIPDKTYLVGLSYRF